MQISTHSTGTPESTAAGGDFKATAVLAAVLQGVESNAHGMRAQGGVSPGQYQRLVRQLGEMLDSLPEGDKLQQLLRHYPAAAVVYENRRYELAGLCRLPLELSLASEQAARAAIDRARALRA